MFSFKNYDTILPKDLIKSRPCEQQLAEYEPAKIWKRFKISYAGKHTGNLTKLKFSKTQFTQNSPLALQLLIGGSTVVSINELRRADSKLTVVDTKKYTYFKSFVQTLSIRSDGELACTADDTGMIQIFAIKNRTQIRKFKTQTGAVRACCFFNNNITHCVTGGDNGTICIWDITSKDPVISVEKAHMDRITCIASDPSTQRVSSSLMFASGCADGVVKVWNVDLSSNEYNQLHLFQHGEAVTDLKYFSIGGLFATTGGCILKVWDATGSGKLLNSICSHVKIITCVCIPPDNSCIITGSIDQSVKFHCSSSGKVLQSISCDDPVASVDLALNADSSETLAIGFMDGHWVIRQYVPPDLAKFSRKEKIHSLKRKHGELDSMGFFKRGADNPISKEDILVETSSSKRSNILNRLIQSYQHQLALEHAIKKGSETAVALIDLFLNRDVLKNAVRGKDDRTILPFLEFLHTKFGTDTACLPVLLEFFQTLLEENPWLYLSSNPDIIKALQKISSKLELDISQHQILREISGLITTIELLTNI